MWCLLPTPHQHSFPERWNFAAVINGEIPFPLSVLTLSSKVDHLPGWFKLFNSEILGRNSRFCVRQFQLKPHLTSDTEPRTEHRTPLHVLPWNTLSHQPNPSWKQTSSLQIWVGEVTSQPTLNPFHLKLTPKLQTAQTPSTVSQITTFPSLKMLRGTSFQAQMLRLMNSWGGEILIIKFKGLNLPLPGC